MVNICKNIKKKKHAQITFPFGIWTSYKTPVFSFPTPSSEIVFCFYHPTHTEYYSLNSA